MRFQEKVERWYKLKQDLARVKTEEMVLRREIAAELITPGDSSGSYEHDHYKVTATAKQYAKIDEGVIMAIRPQLTEADWACLNYKPSLLLRKYNKLPEGSFLHEAITFTPGAPTVKLEFQDPNKG